MTDETLNLILSGALVGLVGGIIAAALRYFIERNDYYRLTQAIEACNRDLDAFKVNGMPWRPIDSAPRDGTPILAYCVHEADPYYDGNRLTDYGARAEGMSHVEDGPQVVAWYEGEWISDGPELESYWMPGWWVAFHDPEVAANPTRWLPVPPAPES